MDNANKDMQTLHSEIHTWKEMLALVKDETLLFERQLEEMVRKQPAKEMMAYVQQFESMFIRQKEVNDEFQHTLNEADHNLRVLVESHPEAASAPLPDHIELREQAVIFEKLFLEMRKDFRQFQLMVAHA